MTLDEIKSETLKDETLQKVSALIRNNAWHTVAVRQNEHVKSELTVSHENDIILKGSRIVIPSSLEYRVLQLAHEAHQGITKTKALLRETVWFPGIDRQAEAMVRNCLACQATIPETHTEPLKMSDLPDTVWKDVYENTWKMPKMLHTWKQHLHKFLREYRSTSHSTTTTSPVELLLKRRIRARTLDRTRIFAGDHKAKAKKVYSDTCRHAAHYSLQPGDMVLCSQPRRNKLTAPYHRKPYKVTTVKGSMVTAEWNGHRVTRNSSFFEKLDPGLRDTSTAEEDEEVTTDTVPVVARYPTRHRQPPQFLRDFVTA
ncbi:K02A2.6-like [Pimephales promelas]|nr:K02A2.6-like [Pimephales promelas]